MISYKIGDIKYIFINTKIHPKAKAKGFLFERFVIIFINTNKGGIKCPLLISIFYHGLTLFKKFLRSSDVCFGLVLLSRFIDPLSHDL